MNQSTPASQIPALNTESLVNNVNPDPPVIKPNTLKYVAPPHVKKESQLGPSMSAGKNTVGGSGSPKLEKIGSVGSVFSKPNQ